MANRTFIESTVIPEDLELRLVFLEKYKRVRGESLETEEFSIKKQLDTIQDVSRQYTKDSKPPENHPYRKDLENTQLVKNLAAKYSANKNVLPPDEIKLIIEEVSKCVNLKDSIVRDLRTEMNSSLSAHDHCMGVTTNVISSHKELIKKLSDASQSDFDQRKVSLTKDTINRMLERLSSSITQGCREIDELVVRSLNKLWSDQDDSLKEQTSKILRAVEKEEATQNSTKRDDILQILYDHYKDVLKTSVSLRQTVRNSTVLNQVALVDANMLRAENISSYSDNPYLAKIQQIKDKMFAVLDEVVESITVTKAELNKMKAKLSKIGDYQSEGPEQTHQTFKTIVESIKEIHMTIYSVLFTDVGLFYSLLCKSYQYANRKVFAEMQIAVQNYIEAENSSLYLQLIQQGTTDLPIAIDNFLNRFRFHLTNLHKLNVDGYLTVQFYEGDAEIMALKSVVRRNYKAACKVIDFAVDKINLYLEEVKNGRSRNGINYSIYNREYHQLILLLSPKIASLEEYKKFTLASFDPITWEDDKQRIKAMSQIIYDLAGLSKDKALTNDKRFIMMRDNVSVLKAEVAQFSHVIHAAQTASPEIRDIVKCYIKVLRGFWTRVREEISKVENLMAQIIATGGIAEPKSIDQAHKIQKEAVGKITAALANLKPEELLNRDRNLARRKQFDDAYQNYEKIAADPSLKATFTLSYDGRATEVDYNQHVFQALVPDLQKVMGWVFSAYEELQLASIIQDWRTYGDEQNIQVISNKTIADLQRRRKLADTPEYARVTGMSNAKSLSPVLDQFKQLRDDIQNLGQNYVEYNLVIVKLCEYLKKLLTLKTSAEVQQVHNEIQSELKRRSDPIYELMNRDLAGYLRDRFNPQDAQKYTQPAPAPAGGPGASQFPQQPGQYPPGTGNPMGGAAGGVGQSAYPPQGAGNPGANPNGGVAGSQFGGPSGPGQYGGQSGAPVGGQGGAPAGQYSGQPGPGAGGQYGGQAGAGGQNGGPAGPAAGSQFGGQAGAGAQYGGQAGAGGQYGGQAGAGAGGQYGGQGGAGTPNQYGGPGGPTGGPTGGAGAQGQGQYAAQVYNQGGAGNQGGGQPGGPGGAGYNGQPGGIPPNQAGGSQYQGPR